MLEEEIIKKAYEASDLIKETEEYKALKNAYDRLMSDKDSLKLIDEFNRLKDLYEKKCVSDKEMSDCKKKLYTSSLYIDYMKSLDAYNEMTKEIEDEINSTIFSEDTKKLVKMK